MADWNVRSEADRVVWAYLTARSNEKVIEALSASFCDLDRKAALVIYAVFVIVALFTSMQGDSISKGKQVRLEDGGSPRE